jgi:hypothetical protein
MEIHNDINLKYVVQSQEVPSLIKLDVGKNQDLPHEID